MTLPDPRTSVLLERWRKGEDAALDELRRKHADWIYRKVHSCMSPALRAKLETVDLVQEAMLEFLKNVPRFKIKNGRLFRGLMLKIIERTQFNEYRRWCAQRREMARERPLSNDTVLNLESPMTDPPDAADKNEREAWIRFGMEFLSEPEQEILFLRDHENLSFVEIGKQLGTTEDAARMRYNRAVDQLTPIVGKLRRGELDDLIPRADD